MSLNREPAKLEQVSSRSFITKRAAILAVKIEPAPVFAPLPGFGFVRMSAFGVAGGFVKHPSIKLLKDFFGHSNAIIVGPTTDDRVHCCQDHLNIGPLDFFPKVLERIAYLLH